MYADFYPIWKVWSEAFIARRRINNDLASQTLSRYMAAVASTPQSKKGGGAQKAQKLFNDYLKGLTDG